VAAGPGLVRPVDRLELLAAPAGADGDARERGDSLVEIVLVGVHQGRTVGSLSFVRVGGPLAVLKTTALWPDSVVSSLTRKLAARLTSR
jgi:hypothetical protein